MSTNQMLQENNKGFLSFLYQKRKIWILFCGSAAVLSTVISFLIKPQYLSTAIVFPAATSSVSFSEQRNAKAAAMDFGEEEQAEQLIQILQSSKIRDRVVSEFQLLKHYEIDPSDANKNYKLNQEYSGHFSFSRTRFGSIKIDVLDQDPVLAAKMANRIVELIDRDLILAKLDSLADLGVIALDVRSNLFQAYVDAQNENDRAELKKKIDVNMKYGAMYDGLEYMRNEKIVKIEDFNVSYEQAESDANTKFSHKFIVERAVVADKKEKPKRLIIVLVTTILAFVVSVFSLLLWEKYKELKA
jgi:tyrosine-protein kinase Etk/Wzc